MRAGRAPWTTRPIYRELRKQGYRGWVAMEFLPSEMPLQNSAGSVGDILSLPNRPGW
jgi:hypothetical protein